MPTIRARATVAVLLVGLVVGAAPPDPVAGWVRDLASEDPATWRRAVRKLWEAGKAAEPALRAAMKHPDADVVLRARLVLTRFDWGIYPDTPPAVVRAVERYRDGDAAQRRAAAEELVKQGKSGYSALRRLLSREPDAALRQQAAEQLRRHYRPLLRDLLAAGDRPGAEELLEATAVGGAGSALRDLAALWALAGPATRAQELERLAAAGDRQAAARCAWLHRARGDLGAARRLAEKINDPELVPGILDEQEDYAELLRAAPKFPSTPAHLAFLLYRAGDRAAFESALARVPAGQRRADAALLYFTGRPAEGVAADRRSGSLAAACAVLAAQGRRHDALALAFDGPPRSQDGPVWLGLEQAKLAHRMGEKDTARRLLAEAWPGAEARASQTLSPLAEAVRVGLAVRGRREMLDEVGRAFDRVKPSAPGDVLAVLFPRAGGAPRQWWDFLRRRSPGDSPSATLARLRGWFEDGKADKDLDALLVEARRWPLPTFEQQDAWHAAVAAVCVAVGRPKQAEEVLRATARDSGTASAYLRLGDFLFERKRWAEAAAEYDRASQKGLADPLVWYLRGMARVRGGRVKEGRALIERARLLPLADEEARYNLAGALARRGLLDEADAERALLVRMAPFRSIYTANVVAPLAARAAREKQYFEAARYYRRIATNLALGGGAFIDSTAYLRVPGLAHTYQARGLLAAGKLDAALAEARQAHVHLPEETALVIDLVGALDRAGRRADGDRLFEGMFRLHQRACVAAPKAAGCHNRLAWLAVRCGRQLDLARRHALRAVALAPDAPGYRDTLAEVHFQRGEQTEAVAAIRQALKLAPADAYFAAQLRRMEAGDRSAALPQR